MTGLSAGEVLGGKYVVQRLLGNGGSAEVYEAEHAVMGHHVAIKMMRPHDEGSRELLERFEREMRISALLRHRHLLEVFDVGVRDDGSPFLVMELLEGADLEAHIAGGAMTVPDVVDTGCQLLAALSALAGHGVVHRDVKPQNIMVCEEDGETVVKLVDFGIAHCPRNTDVTGKITREGLFVGTPHYMSPEQVLAQPLDHRADVYGAGAVLYEALTGRPPFSGETPTAVVAAVLRDSVTPVRQLRPDCPAALERVVMRALARERESRWRHPRAMREALLAIWRGLDPAERGPRPQRPGSLHPRTISTAASTATDAELEPASDVRRAPSDAPPRPRARRASVRMLAVAAGAAAGVLVAAAIWAWAGPTSAARPSEPDPPPPDLEAARPGPDSIAATEPSSQGSADAGTSDHAAIEDGGVRDGGVGRDGGGEDGRADGGMAGELPRSTPPDPEAARQLADRALGAYVRGENRNARALYRRSLAHAPGHPSAWRGLGVVADELGDTRAARRALRRYLRLAPGAPDGERVRTRLRQLPR